MTQSNGNLFASSMWSTINIFNVSIACTNHSTEYFIDLFNQTLGHRPTAKHHIRINIQFIFTHSIKSNQSISGKAIESYVGENGRRVVFFSSPDIFLIPISWIPFRFIRSICALPERQNGRFGIDLSST